MAAQCPSRAELESFQIGDVDDERFTPLAAHVEGCDACQRILETMIGHSPDTVLSALLGAREANSFSSEVACREAVQRIASLGNPPAAPPSPPEKLPVEAIREYKLLSKLGEGGMGAVYKALHSRLEKTVAIKILPADRMRDKDAVARFQREMKAVGRLDHANIVRAMDAGEEAGMHFLVMEYVDGVDLSNLAANTGPLPIADACELVRQAALGLQEAHEHCMVHRDIKPSNLILARSRRKKEQPAVKILDLGLALLSEALAPNQQGLTSTGQMMGTIDYMAPEQGGDSHLVDIRADIYSLGATLYRLLTGTPPFAGERYDTPVKKLLALATQMPTPVNQLRPDVPPQLAAIVEKMLAKEPAARLSTPEELADVLQPFASGANLATLLDRKEGTPAKSFSEARTSPYLSSASAETAPTIPLASRAAAALPPRSRSRTIAIAAACSAALIGMFLGVVFFVQTPEGTIRVEIEDPSIEVKIKGTAITLKKAHNGKDVKLSPGKKTLVVNLYGTTFETDNFTLKKNGETTLRVQLIGREVRVLKDEGEVLKQFQLEFDPTANKPDPPTVAAADFAPKFALAFDGNAVVTAETPKFDPHAPFTLEAWVRLNELGKGPDGGRIMRPWGPVGIDNFIEFRICLQDHTPDGGVVENNCKTFGPPELHRWSHVAGTFDGKKYNLFVDGKRQTNYGRFRFADRFSEQAHESPLVNMRPSDAKDILSIGGDWYEDGHMDHPLNGDLAEIRVSQTVRYKDEFAPKHRLETDEFTWSLYHIDDASTSDVLTDSSGKNHHGKIIRAKRVSLDKSHRAGSPTVSAPKAFAQLDRELIPDLDTRPWMSQNVVAIVGGLKGRTMLSVEAMEVSRDGKWLMCFTGASGGGPHYFLYDSQTLRLQMDESTHNPGFLENGKFILAGRKIWGVAPSGMVDRGPLEIPKTGTGLATSPSGSIAAFVLNGRVDLWDWKDGRLQPRAGIDTHEPKSGIRLLDDKTLLTFLAEERTGHVWDLSGEKPREKFALREIFNPSPSADGKTLAAVEVVSGKPVGAILWDVSGDEPREIRRWAIPNLVPASLQKSAFLSPDAKYVAAICRVQNQQKLQIWSTEKSDAPVSEWKDPLNGASAVAFSPDGGTLYVGSSLVGGSIQILDFADGKLTTRFQPSLPIGRLKLSPDGRRLASQNNTLNTWWDLTGATPQQLPAIDPEYSVLEVGQRGAILRKEMELAFWDGKVHQAFVGVPDRNDVAITPDGRTLVHADPTGKQVDVFTIEESGSRKKVATLDASPYFLRIRPDGKAILAGAKDRTLQMFQWGPDGWQETWKPAKHFDAALATHADRFAYWSNEKGNELYVVDFSQSPREVATFKNFSNVCLSPDGQRVAQVSATTGKLSVYDVDSQRLLRTYDCGAGVTTAAFAADGRHVVACTNLGAAVVIRMGDDAASPGVLPTAAAEPAPAPERLAVQELLKLGAQLELQVGNQIVSVSDPTGSLPPAFQAVGVSLTGKPVSNASLASLRALPALKTLDLAGTKVDDSCLEQIGQILTLEKLNLAQTPITNRGFKHLLFLKNLKELDLHGTPITKTARDAFQQVVPDCKIAWEPSPVANPDREAAQKLKQQGVAFWGETIPGHERVNNTIPEGDFILTGVWLQQNPIANDKTLELVRGLPHLTHLHMVGVQLSDEGIENLRALPELTYVCTDSARLTGKSLAVYATCPKLQFAILPNAAITDDDLAMLAGHRSLKALDIGLTKVTGSGFHHLANTGITDLKLSHNKLRPDALALLHEALPNLETLLIHGCNLQPDSYRPLAMFTKLKELGAEGTRGHEVAVGNGGITDEGLASIGPLPTLQLLALDRAPITQQGLKHVAAHKNLKVLFLDETTTDDQGLTELQPLDKLTELNLRRTKVSKAGVDAFHKVRPGCKIISDFGEVPAN